MSPFCGTGFDLAHPTLTQIQVQEMPQTPSKRWSICPSRFVSRTKCPKLAGANVRATGPRLMPARSRSMKEEMVQWPCGKHRREATLRQLCPRMESRLTSLFDSHLKPRSPTPMDSMGPVLPGYPREVTCMGQPHLTELRASMQ